MCQRIHVPHGLQSAGAQDVVDANDVLVVEAQQDLDLSQRALAIRLVLERADLLDGHAGGGHIVQGRAERWAAECVGGREREAEREEEGWRERERERKLRLHTALAAVPFIAGWGKLGDNAQKQSTAGSLVRFPFQNHCTVL